MSRSKSLRKLADKAESYLLASKGDGVQVVIGIECSHPTARRLDIHVWRLCIEKAGKDVRCKAQKELEHQIFDGKNVRSGYYALKLKDFAPAKALALEYPGADLEKEILLRYRDLASFYQEAKEVRENGGSV